MRSLAFLAAVAALAFHLSLAAPPAFAFDPVYEGGYPTKETAEKMFEEYDYQAAVQFYVWGYAYLNNLGHEKGMARMGGDERSFYVWDKRIQPQHVLMTANAEVVYNWSRWHCHINWVGRKVRWALNWPDAPALL